MSRWLADEGGKYVPKLELMDVVRYMIDVSWGKSRGIMYFLPFFVALLR
jgi:hypothetical protein